MQLAEIRHMSATSAVPDTVESLLYDTRYLHSVAYRDVYSGLSATLVTRHVLLNDANFNVTALVATNGAVVERYTYDPYGKATIRDATWQPITWDDSQKNICLYTGHKFDAESGLYYSPYRYYHPGLGRWANRDPLGEIRRIETTRKIMTFKSLQLTRQTTSTSKIFLSSTRRQVGDERQPRSNPTDSYYTYVNGHPTDLTDRLGLCTKEEGLTSFKKLQEVLFKRCKEPCCECINKEENKWKPCDPTDCKIDAERIVKVLRKTWENNWGNGCHVDGPKSDSVGNWFCWDWAAGFEAAVKSLKPKCWNVKQWKVQTKPDEETASDNRTDQDKKKKVEIPTHVYIALYACKADEQSDYDLVGKKACEVYVDDCFENEYINKAPEVWHEPIWPNPKKWIYGPFSPPNIDAGKYCNPGVTVPTL